MKQETYGCQFTSKITSSGLGLIDFKLNIVILVFVSNYRSNTK